MNWSIWDSPSDWSLHHCVHCTEPLIGWYLHSLTSPDPPSHPSAGDRRWRQYFTGRLRPAPDGLTSRKYWIERNINTYFLEYFVYLLLKNLTCLWHRCWWGRQYQIISLIAIPSRARRLGSQLGVYRDSSEVSREVIGLSGSHRRRHWAHGLTLLSITLPMEFQSTPSSSNNWQ